jgi:CRISPR-associated protein Cmr1
LNYLKLTPHSLIWTGDYQGRSSKLLLTGLKGSLRWWYETLLRGLGAYVCDPTSNEACGLDLSGGFKNQWNRASVADKIELVRTRVCPACYLFGCTGWKSRFGLTIPALEQATKGTTIELRIKERFGAPVTAEEWALLAIMFSFISDHGSIGAKGGLKPSEDSNKNSRNHHRNYGLCAVILDPGVASLESPDSELNFAAQIKSFCESFRFEQTKIKLEWPDFRYIWYVDQCVNRVEMNNMVMRSPDNPHPYLPLAGIKQKWIGGWGGVSKKIFSFHNSDTGGLNSARSWGYCIANQDYKNWIQANLPVSAPATLRWGEDFLRNKGAIE